MRISDWSSDVCSSDLRENCDGWLSDGKSRRSDNRRQQPFESLAGVGQFGRDARRTRMNFGTDMMGDEPDDAFPIRSEEHTSELQSLMRISYAVSCLKKKREHNLHITYGTSI